MLSKVERLFVKKMIDPSSVMYAMREGRQTLLVLDDGRVIDTYIPVKYIYDSMPAESFLNITKGVIVSKNT